MNCNEFEELIVGCVDGMYDEPVQRRMEEHRASCPECARLFALHARIASSLNSAEPVTAPPELSSRILAAVAREDAVSHEHTFFPWASVAATAAFVFVTGFLFRIESLIITGSWEMDTGLISNGPRLFEWPALIRAWLRGLPGSAWVQKLMEPVSISFLPQPVPLCGLIGYAFFLGLLIWYAASYFRSAPWDGIAKTARLSRRESSR